jgi:hypothetical protein
LLRRGADVEGALADLLDGGNARQRQEEAEVVREVGVVAGDRLAGCQVLGLQRLAVGREDELGLLRGGAGAGAQDGQRIGDLTGRTRGDVDVVALEHAANVGFVGRAGPQPLERRPLLPEGCKKIESELAAVKSPLGELRDGRFDLDRVHSGATSVLLCPRCSGVAAPAETRYLKYLSRNSRRRHGWSLTSFSEGSRS